MSARPGIIVDVKHPSDGGESPNRYAPYVSAHIRIYWPRLATDAEIEAALSEAVVDARASIAKRRGVR